MFPVHSFHSAGLCTETTPLRSSSSLVCPSFNSIPESFHFIRRCSLDIYPFSRVFIVTEAVTTLWSFFMLLALETKRRNSKRITEGARLKHTQLA